MRNHFFDLNGKKFEFFITDNQIVNYFRKYKPNETKVELNRC